MSKTFFECKVKYATISESGFEKVRVHSILVDAVSYSDAELRIAQIMPELTSSTFMVKSITKTNITEAIDKDGEWWFKSKISMVVLDDETGREKKVSEYILVSADDVHQALLNVSEGLDYVLVPFDVESISISKIEDVYPYIDPESV